MGHGRFFKVPFGFLWLVDEKYYGTGKHFVVKVTTLAKSFKRLEALIRKMEPSRQGLH